jgi:hypothetical protein
MLQAARQRGFQPEFVLFDSWHASLENLKLIRSAGWQWLTRLEYNRHMLIQIGLEIFCLIRSMSLRRAVLFISKAMA